MATRYIIFTIWLLFALVPLQAQFDLRVQVNDFSGQSGSLYLAGDFNSWQPGDKRFELSRINYFRNEITLHHLPSGRFEFKLNRGSIESVETAVDGVDIPNRNIVLKNDTSVLLDVKSWKDIDRDPTHINDSIRMQNALRNGFAFINSNLDSSYKYALETYSLAVKQSNPRMKAYAINLEGEVLVKLGNFQKALELYDEGLKIRMALKDSGAIVYLYCEVGDVYWQMNDSINAVRNYRLAMPWIPPLMYIHPLHEVLCNLYCNIGRYFLGKNQLDSARWYAARAGEVGDKISTHVEIFLGDIERHQNNPQKAIQYFHFSGGAGSSPRS